MKYRDWFRLPCDLYVPRNWMRDENNIFQVFRGKFAFGLEVLRRMKLIDETNNRKNLERILNIYLTCRNISYLDAISQISF